MTTINSTAMVSMNSTTIASINSTAMASMNSTIMDSIMYLIATNNLTAIASMNVTKLNLSPAQIGILQNAFAKMSKMRNEQNGLKFSVMNISICLPLLLLQLTSLPIFLIFPNYRRNVCFRILFTNGVAECLQLGVMLIFAILNLGVKNIGEQIQRIGGAIILPAWSLVVAQHLLLSLNRLVVIMRARYLGSKYIPDVELESRMFNMAHLFLWTVYLGLVALFLSPWVGSVFYPGTSVFVFDRRRPYTETFRAVNCYVTSLLPGSCFFIYVLIVWSATKSRKFSNEQSTSSQQPLLNDYERRLLIQAIILYSLMSMLIICWYIFEKCNNNGICVGSIFGMEFVHLSYQWHAVLIEAPWMIYCGLNPILFLTMNKDFRNRYLQLYLPKKTAALIGQLITSITIVPCSTSSARRRMVQDLQNRRLQAVQAQNATKSEEQNAKNETTPKRNITT